MPSLIGVTVNGVSVAQNYRQQQVPFSRFGSRKIVWFKISHADTQQSSGVLDQVVFNKLIDGIQTKAEIVTVGAPKISNDWGRFIVGVFEDTFNNGIMTKGIDDSNTATGYNSMSETLEDALQAMVEDGNITVDEIYMFGAPASDEAGYGWEFSDVYEEYATKAEFDANSYTK
jgi:hypothetical protein